MEHSAVKKLYATPEDAITAILRWPSFRTAKHTNTWVYHNTDGAVAFHVARLDLPDGNKQFRPVRPVNGQWAIEDPPGRLPLYRLPEVMEAVRQAKTIFIVEGEKCADALITIGTPATTSAHGSKSANRTDWSPLRGAAVVIQPDNDNPGRAYADTVAGILSKLNPPASVRILRLPGLPEAGDIADYIDGKECLDEDDLRHGIEEMAESTPVWQASPAGLISVCIAAVEREDVEWLWHSRIALGKLTILAGDGGLGKSFVSLDIASRTTTGTPWPDRQDEPNPVGGVILLNCEDGVADTIRPRLENCRADLTRVFAIIGVRRLEEPDHVDMFSLERDLRHLESEIAAHPETRLIVVDPLSAYLGQKVDAHKDADVRRILGPVAAMAAKRRVAVLAIMHLNKSPTMSALYRPTGSIAFGAAARASWIVCRDPEDPTHMFMLQAKNNLAPDPGGLGFHISQPGVVLWDAHPVHVSVDEVLAPKGPKAHKARDEAAEWLQDMLTNGPVLSSELYDQADQAGIARRTLKRVKENIDAIARKRKTDEGWRWFWMLRDDKTDSKDAQAAPS